MVLATLTARGQKCHVHTSSPAVNMESGIKSDFDNLCKNGQRGNCCDFKLETKGWANWRKMSI